MGRRPQQASATGRTDVWYGLPRGLYVIRKRLPNEGVAKLYRREGRAGQDVLLLDPEKVSLTGSARNKGKNAIQGVAVSDDCNYVLESFLAARQQVVRVWPPSDSTTGAPESEMRQKFRSYLHVLGTNPKQDKSVFGYGVVPSIDVDPSLIASVETQPGSNYALGILNGSVTPDNAYYIAPDDAIGKSNDQ